MPPLPSALEHLDTILHLASNRRLVVFLDYDGTLTPIVTRPEDANLSEDMRTALTKLARTRPVAIVSGRDLQDVRTRVQLDTLYYAGSHGFEIAGPHGLHAIHEPARSFLPTLDAAANALQERLDGIAGAQVERKRFAIAVHYRRVRQAEAEAVASVVAAVQQAYPTLRQSGGKKVYELRPNLDWHKGTALFWLLEAMELRRADVLPVYVGDDVTDEDAFEALRQEGIGIVVTDEMRPSAARYALSDTPAVREFLTALAAAPGGNGT